MKIGELLEEQMKWKKKLREVDEKRDAIIKKEGFWTENPELDRLNEERGVCEEKLYDIFLELEYYD